jgi:hypothetical protein
MIHLRPITRPLRLPRNITAARCLSSRAKAVLSALDLPTDDKTELAGVYDGTWFGSGELLESRCPATGEVIGRVRAVSLQFKFPELDAKFSKASKDDVQRVLEKSREAFHTFKMVPAPRRGEILRLIRQRLADKVLPSSSSHQLEPIQFTERCTRGARLARNGQDSNGGNRRSARVH